MSITIIIFDMDGVLSDTQHLHALAESALLKRYGIDIAPDEITRRFAGYSDHEFYSTVFREAGKLVNLDHVIPEKWGPFLEQAKGNIIAIPGAADTVHRLRAAGFKIGVASASIPEFIALVVDTLGLRQDFDSLTSGNEVKQGKPAPDVFLLAAERLRAKPEECLVIEDGVNGMVAAKRAGMKCIGFVRAHLASLHPEYPADVVVDAHEKITPELVRSLGQS